MIRCTLILLAACTAAEPDPGNRPGSTGSSTLPSTTPTASTPTPTTSPTPTVSTTTTTTPTVVTTTTTSVVGTVSTETVVPPEDPSQLLFDDTVLHEIAIETDEAGVAGLVSDPYVYVPGSVTVDGVTVHEVGVRLRGKLGSFRDLDEKPKFKVDLNQYVAGRTLAGVETLTLNNSVGDCTYLVEALGYSVFRDAGIPASRLSFATVTFNGLPYGLYQMVETQDDRYLNHHFEDPSGNLYDGKYTFEDGFDFETLDFEPDLVPLFQLEEGADVGNADLEALTQAVYTHRGTPGFYAETGLFLDWPHTHQYLVAEQWIAQWDGYALNQNNYRVYFEPRSGLAQLLPFDLDLAMDDSDFWYFLFSWNDPAGILAETCFDDPTCKTTHQAAMAVLLDTMATVDLDARLDAWDTLTHDAAMVDPRKECGNADVTRTRGELRATAATRDGEMRDFWGL
jgi:hypothetical protein